VNNQKSISIGLIGAIGFGTLNTWHPDISHIHPKTDVDLFHTNPKLVVASSTATVATNLGTVAWTTR
jgi:hypothetical protein